MGSRSETSEATESVAVNIIAIQNFGEWVWKFFWLAPRAKQQNVSKVGIVTMIVVWQVSKAEDDGLDVPADGNLI